MYLLRVLFYDGGEHTQQFKYVQFLCVFINKGKSITVLDQRYTRVDCLRRGCDENEQGEVSALFQVKRQNR